MDLALSSERDSAQLRQPPLVAMENEDMLPGYRSSGGRRGKKRLDNNRN